MFKLKLQGFITKLKYHLDLKSFFISFSLSFLWIYSSDYIVFRMANKATDYEIYQNYKGTAYVFLFSLILSFIYRREKHFQSLLLMTKRHSFIGEYSSLIVHEVKNPLASISLSLDLLKRKQDKKTIERTIENGSQAIQNLKETISLLQILARGEKVNAKNLQQTVAVHDQINSVFKLMKKQVYKKDIAFNNHVPQNLQIKGNQSLILHVFMNLTKNALEDIEASKLTHGQINISYQETDFFHQLIVENSGKPIPSEIQSFLFTNFTSKGEKEGSGLGLIFCKEVMSLHNGKIEHNKDAGHPRFDLFFPKS